MMINKDPTCSCGCESDSLCAPGLYWASVTARPDVQREKHQDSSGTGLDLLLKSCRPAKYCGAGSVAGKRHSQTRCAM